MKIDPSLGLPAKYTDWRESQYQAVQAVAASDRPAFLLDAPTGVGKSLLAIGAHRMLDERCIYITRTKQLQDQIMGDFGDIAVSLKGKLNYPCALKYDQFPDVTADDCRYNTPKKCEKFSQCPYFVAKNAARNSPLVVLNDAYFLNEANGFNGTFSETDFLIVDECIPAGTKIATPKGDVDIELLKHGDIVWGYKDGKIILSAVEGLSVRETKEPLTNTNGLDSTYNHPIWTQDRNYVKAIHVNHLDRVGVIWYNGNYDKPNMRTVRARVSTKTEAKFIKEPLSFLQSNMFIGLQEREIGQNPYSSLPSMRQRVSGSNEQPSLLFAQLLIEAYCQFRSGKTKCATNAGGSKVTRNPREITTVSTFREKSDIQTRSAHQSSNGYESKTMEKCFEWREWDRFNFTSENTCFSFRLGNGICCACRLSRTGFTSKISNRHCGTSVKNSYRGGWEKSSPKTESGSRQTERGFSNFKGMESFPVYEQRGSCESGNCGQEGNGFHTVYNLKTSTGNYFANNLLIHNCDSIESSLMNFIQFTITAGQIDKLGLKMPADPSVRKGWMEWIPDAVRLLTDWAGQIDDRLSSSRQWGKEEIFQGRIKRRYEKLAGKLEWLQTECDSSWLFYTRDNIDRWTGEQSREWVFKPVNIGRYAKYYLWGHGARSLGMSGTIFAPDIECRELGIGECDYMRMDSPFPLENRPVYYTPVVSLSRKTMPAELPVLCQEIDEILERYPDEKVLIHTVSYAIQSYLLKNLSCPGRLTYHTSGNREAALIEFKSSSQPLVMLSPSFDRGVDLPGEDNCGCIIVCKMPYLDLSDPQVKRKIESPGGGTWYALKTAQTLVQMCGRAVRSSTQRCDSYILDRQFSRLRSQLGAILPEWWLKAIQEKPVSLKSTGRMV